MPKRNHFLRETVPHLGNLFVIAKNVKKFPKSMQEGKFCCHCEKWIKFPKKHAKGGLDICAMPKRTIFFVENFPYLRTTQKFL